MSQSKRASYSRVASGLVFAVLLLIVVRETGLGPAYMDDARLSWTTTEHTVQVARAQVIVPRTPLERCTASCRPAGALCDAATDAMSCDQEMGSDVDYVIEHDNVFCFTPGIKFGSLEVDATTTERVGQHPGLHYRATFRRQEFGLQSCRNFRKAMGHSLGLQLREEIAQRAEAKERRTR